MPFTPRTACPTFDTAHILVHVGREPADVGPSRVAEQVPGRLRRIDDPWGLTWRVRNQVHKIDVRRSVRMQVARTRQVHFERPVFVVGAPRSGTTALFRTLGAHPDLASLGHEAHDCWRRFHHPRRTGWQSDWVPAGCVSPRERSFVNRWFHARLGDGRFVEKTPENALRIPYLLELFPDAHVVWVKRDPRAVVSSMLTGWRDPAGRFRSYYVPERLSIEGYDHSSRWCFGLVDGWRDLRAAPLAKVVGEQWRQFTAGAVAGRELVPAEQWHEVQLEDLVERPTAVVGELLAALHLGDSRRVLTRAAALSERAEHSLGDRPGDWRENAEEVQSALDGLTDPRGSN